MKDKQTPESDASDRPSPQGTARFKDAFLKPYPWLTWLMCAICILVWMGVQSEGTITNWDQMNRWGYYSYQTILSGKYWSLLTSNFFHQDFFHLFFNLSWVVLLGSKIERESGRISLFTLTLGACLVSSGSEIMFSGESGIGISGVVYGFVGFVMLCSQGLSAYRNYLGRNDYIWLILWLFICVFATQMDLMHIANAAHFGGFAWGICFAAAFTVKKWLLPACLGLAALLGVSLLPLIWMPWSAQWLEYEGLQAYLRQDMALAEKYLNLANIKHPDSAPVHIALARLYDEQKLHQKSLEHYQKAEAISPSYITEMQLALLYLQQANYDEAYKAAQQALEKKPDNDVIKKVIVVVEMERKHWPEAKKILETILLKEPTNILNLNMLGTTEAALGNTVLAEKHYRHVLAIDKANTEAESGLLKLLTQNKQWDMAEKRAVDALKRHPEDIELLIMLGYIYLEQGQTLKGIDINTRLLSRPGISSSHLSIAHYNLACGFARQNKQTDVLEHLKKAVEKNPRLKLEAQKEPDFKALYNLAAFKQLLR